MSESQQLQSRRRVAEHAVLGERVRQLRVAASLTQAQLAADRFSKEYISQIERGKTRPTRDTVEWLAGRLGVDASFLEHGVSADERERIEGALSRAAALSESDRFVEAVQEYEGIRAGVVSTGSAELEVRMLAGEAWARMRSGDVRHAIELLGRALRLADGPSFSDVDRADLLFRLGACRYKLSSISTALSLFNEALALADSSVLPCDLLRSNILAARSRCYRRLRDWQAAREDIERALELAEAARNNRALAEGYFQASLIAERNAQWVAARRYAEKAKEIYEEISDALNVGRLLNNLGGLNFLLGRPEEAKNYLRSAFRQALNSGSKPDAAQAVASLAQVHLRTDDPQTAEDHARQALELLEGRVDFVDEIGNAQLVLGRALLAQDRLDEADAVFRAAEGSFEQMSSISHRAAVWMAQGDAATRRGDDVSAARLYRKAAEALQDVHF